MVNLTQTGGHCLFHDGLAGRDAVEGGVQAEALHRESGTVGNESLPGQLAGSLEKLLKGDCPEGTKQDEHTLTGAQTKVQAGNILYATVTEYSAVFHTDILHFHSTQLVSSQAFHTQQGGNGEGQFSHGTLPLLYIMATVNQLYLFFATLANLFFVKTGRPFVFFDFDGLK